MWQQQQTNQNPIDTASVFTRDLDTLIASCIAQCCKNGYGILFGMNKTKTKIVLTVYPPYGQKQSVVITTEQELIEALTELYETMVKLNGR